MFLLKQRYIIKEILFLRQICVMYRTTMQMKFEMI